MWLHQVASLTRSPTWAKAVENAEPPVEVADAEVDATANAEDDAGADAAPSEEADAEADAEAWDTACADGHRINKQTEQRSA